MKTVLITGIGRGIGSALAKKFLAEGYFVIGTYLNSPVESTENLSAHRLDLSSPASIDTCVQEIKKLGKNIDILINNAGVLSDEDQTAVVVEKLRKTLEVNLFGTINFTEKIIPQMTKGGHIVTVSSSAGSLTLVGNESHYEGHYPSYKISKAALNMYTRTLALRLKDLEITVSAVHPGWVKTDMGGEDAEMSPEEAAGFIYSLAISRPETGEFWFKGEKFPW